MAKPVLPRSYVIALMIVALCGTGEARQRLQEIKKRGHLVCGISPGFAGFARPNDRGGYAGFDVDICRAIATAMLGKPDQLQLREAPSIQQFLQSPDIDVVSRRLSWTLERETSFEVLFGPVVFYDGQGFLAASRLRAQSVRDLAGAKICVDAGTLQERRLGTYFQANNIRLLKVVAKPKSDVAALLQGGQCDAYSGDVSELASLRAGMRDASAFHILSTQISKEPLAPLVRAGDRGFFQIVRWAVLALIAAEELRISSINIDVMARSDDPEVRQLLGVTPGIGKALGLDEKWAYRMIKEMGNYAEIYDRHLGPATPIKLDRGLNRLWSDGGLLYAPPLR